MPGSLIGTRISGFLVERLLGEGGMGQVYEARNEQIDKRWAIKVLHDELTKRNDVKARFVQEAVAGAMINHENVVAVQTIDTLPDGRVYIALEYLEGMDLEKYVASVGGRLGERDAALIIEQVCAALHEAHLKGIVHRDLKPANIFITSSRRQPLLVKLLDFGIARIKSAMKSQTMMTGEQQVLGTPAYMSPEQLVSPRSVDQRADVFALGCMIYEILSGRRPFDAETLDGLLLAKKEQRPWPITSLSPGVSLCWDVIVSRCIAWDASARYPDVLSLVADMVNGIEGVGPGIPDAVAMIDDAWPEFRRIASNSDSTRPTAAAAARSSSSTPIYPSAMTTSISGAAGERIGSARPTLPRGGRAGRFVALGSVAAAGMTAAVIAVSRMGGGSGASSPPASQPTQTPSPAPQPQPVAAPGASASTPSRSTTQAAATTSPPTPSPATAAPAAPPTSPTPPPSVESTTAPIATHSTEQPTTTRHPTARHPATRPRPGVEPAKPVAQPTTTDTKPLEVPKQTTQPVPPKHVDPDGVM